MTDPRPVKARTGGSPNRYLLSPELVSGLRGETDTSSETFCLKFLGTGGRGLPK
jgi:hypothetical protein